MFARLKSFKKAVTTAGTRVQLTATVTNAYGLRIKAIKANTGHIYVGDSTVSATVGDFLEPAETLSSVPSFDSQSIPVDLTQIWLDSSVSGEGVSVSYWELYNP